MESAILEFEKKALQQPLEPLSEEFETLSSFRALELLIKHAIWTLSWNLAQISNINSQNITSQLSLLYTNLQGILDLAQQKNLHHKLKKVVQTYILQKFSNSLSIELQKAYKDSIKTGNDGGLTSVLHSYDWSLKADEALKNALNSEIQDYINKHLSLDTSMLGNLLEWSERYLVPFLKNTLQDTQSFESYLLNQCYLLLGKARIYQMLDLVIEFPVSKPALEDLSQSLSRHNLNSELETFLKEVLKKRILHCSKDTEGILFLYINLTKAMKCLFSTIELLESVSDPLKNELRKRPNTFKCIINTIAEDPELYELLDIKQKSVKEQDEFSSDEDEKAASEWQPIPRTALRTNLSALNKRSDIVSMLINIYGSQEQFMEEYRAHLSKKLVNNTSFDVNSEIKDLEMLKKRFGETNVHKCEVMIQDVHSSKRINSYIHEEPWRKTQLRLEVLDSLIISSYFWPIEEEDYHFKMPSHLAPTFEEYSRRYTLAKVSRTLKFHEQLGSVELTLEFENGSKKFQGVKPLHAVMISLLEGETELSAEEIAESLEISEGQVRKEMSFWESRGVVSRKKLGEKLVYSAVKTII